MRFPLDRPGAAEPSAAQVSRHEAQYQPAPGEARAEARTRELLAGQPPRRTAGPASTLPPRASLAALPTEILQALPVDPRRLRLNRRLARDLRDPAVAQAFAERPPRIRSAADVYRAVALLESALPQGVHWRDAPLAALAERLGELGAPERAVAHARLVRAAMAIPRPLAALVALEEAVPVLPVEAQAGARARITTHPAGPVAQALALASRIIEPRTDMPALRERLSVLRMPDQRLVLDALAGHLLSRPDLASHDHVQLAMAHHDLPWPARAAAGLLARIGWVPPDVQQALERCAQGE